MTRTFDCYCSNCGKQYKADIYMGPVSTAVNARCCSIECVRELDKKYYGVLIEGRQKHTNTVISE